MKQQNNFKIGDSVVYNFTEDVNPRLKEIVAEGKEYKVTSVVTDECCMELGLTIGILNQGMNSKGNIVLVSDAIKNGQGTHCRYCGKDTTERNKHRVENVFNAKHFILVREIEHHEL